MQKGERAWQLCKGTANTAKCGFKYWKGWEQGFHGAGVAQENPILQQDWECDESQAVSFSAPDTTARGLGDYAERMMKSLGITEDRYAEIKEKFGLPATCNCTARRNWLNAVGKYIGIG